MDYHDNQVQFVMPVNDMLPASYTLDSGSFIITDFCISPDEDPGRHITVGRVFTCGSSGTFSFRLGQYGSTEVADWFNEKCASNTFERAADKLHFALVGNLLLKVNVGKTHQVDCLFKGVILAQGHAGASNNWWFGTHYPAKRANHVGQALWCSGTIPRSLSQHDAVFMLFKRGGNGPSQVSIEDIKWSPVS